MKNLISYLKTKSKHSEYQLLPERLRILLGISSKKMINHYEIERLNFICNSVEIQDKNILDVGANTGFFTFELLDRSAKKSICFEGNKEHAEFIRLSSKIMCMESKIDVYNRYFDFDADLNNINTEIVILLNVLHHVGDDYGDKKLSKNKVLDQIASTLEKISKVTSILIFQLGFNWQGKINQPLFKMVQNQNF